MAQELNGLIPQIMGSFRQAQRNPNFNPEQPVSDTNTPYKETGMWGRFLGDDSNKRNNAYMEQKLANKMEMDRAAVAPTINAQSAERMHGAPSGNALMQDKTSRYMHDTTGADTLARLTSQEGMDAAGRENARYLAGLHYDDTEAGRAADKANLLLGRQTPRLLTRLSSRETRLKRSTLEKLRVGQSGPMKAFAHLVMTCLRTPSGQSLA